MLCNKVEEQDGDCTVSAHVTITLSLTHSLFVIVCKGIVDLHGGTLAVSSEGEGKGTCFRISLQEECTGAELDVSANYFHAASSSVHPSGPISPENMVTATRNGNQLGAILPCSNDSSLYSSRIEAICPEHTSRIQLSLQDSEHNIKIERSTSSAVSRRIKRILIVDDAASNRKMLRRLLESRSYDCDDAEDGDQAVDMVRASMMVGSDGVYDVIIMDYQMPVMDGVTATSEIRRIGYRNIIIGATGNVLTRDIHAFLSSGADIVLMKPLSISEFDNYMSSIDQLDSCNYVRQFRR